MESKREPSQTSIKIPQNVFHRGTNLRSETIVRLKNQTIVTTSPMTRKRTLLHNQDEQEVNPLMTH